MKLREIEVQVTEAQAAQLSGDVRRGLYFDWSPETQRFHGHIDSAKLPDPAPLLFLTAESPTSKPEPRSTNEAEGKAST